MLRSAVVGAALGAAIACGPPPEPLVGVLISDENHPLDAEDPLAAGFAQADRWARAGHPSTGEDADLFQPPLCTVRRRRNDARCDRPFYHAAVARPERVGRELVARGDDVLTRALVTDIAREYGAGPALAIAREVDGAEPTWREIMFTLADEVRDRSNRGGPAADPRKVAEEAWRHARARRSTASRGAALYVFARIAESQVTCYSECAEIVDWAHFAEWFGDRMGPDDLGAFLDARPDAWSLAYVIAPALGPGWSRAKIFTVRLAARSADDYEAAATAAHAAERLLCREGNESDLHELAHFFREPTPGHPPRTALVASLEHSATTCKRER
jgi:hypothetical protein